MRYKLGSVVVNTDADGNWGYNSITPTIGGQAKQLLQPLDLGIVVAYSNFAAHEIGHSCCLLLSCDEKGENCG
jgi:hypothetical protein